jgi:cyclohexyl-isocyanide hydratase
MRWLYHLVPRGTPIPDPYTPADFAREGFVHASFRDAVRESARLHFPAGADLVALRIDPRRLDVAVDIVATPRGPMPHIPGAVPRDAIRAEVELSDIDAAPDAVTGTRMAFVAFEGMTLLDLVSVYDPLSRIASMGFDRTSSCAIVGATAARVWSEAGATITVDEVRPPLDAFDLVVVPGGHGTRALEKDAQVIAWLSAYPHNRLVASVCTGALLLGAAGRLRGRPATTHHLQIDRLAEYGATATEARVVEAWPVVTAGGVTSGIDLGLHLVRRLMGDEVAAAIARQMEVRASA